MNNQYEVLSPWAEIDPLPLKALSSRVTDLEGKKVGLFVNNKRAAPLIMAAVEQKLQERFPTAEFSYFHFNDRYEAATGPDKAEFEDWVRRLDAAIAAVGD